jgi:hypothetical protein
MASNLQEPKFEFGVLLKAAAMAGIAVRDIPSSVNPWTWNDERARSWQSALRTLAPVLAQDAEIHWGPPISLELAAAIEGDAPWTSDLQAELATKRPHNHAERVQAEMNAALEGLAASVEAERATRAAKTPSPAELQRQIALSRELAYRGPQQ